MDGGDFEQHRRLPQRLVDRYGSQQRFRGQRGRLPRRRYPRRRSHIPVDGVVAGLLVAPRFTRWLASVLVAFFGSEVLQIAYKKAEQTLSA